MNPNCHPFYTHSGKFDIQGPVLALVGGALIALPLGLLYSYLIKWIPFIYLNFLITLGYGLVFGLLTMLCMQFGKVRNRTVALLCAMCVGVLALYGNWNGHVHTLASSAPWILKPRQIFRVMGLLYKEGSWAIGFSSTDRVTGIPLAVVWVIEAGAIVGLTTLVGYGWVASAAFCERHDCWLDQEQKIDKLDAFVDPNHIAAFKTGDISPLDAAQPRVPASGRFARLTLKHSPQCDDFCALSIANVTVTLNKDGKPEEKSQEIISNLWIPKAMFDYLQRFEHPTAKVTSSS